ncbi:hypothetical protein EUA02_20930 [Mycobacterium paragordonae]|uniref:hypothetical protein n=1 Tax=Mycobacterium paragordonae TaxID=1389713 RepID=UPI00105EE948|nr:hypothetical protein [Mycobacterium paragordonae]TDK92268.1 hypothetical protein EUA02_20930 [Mycobacterium paragordonae]TDL04319.1 hypothetical protein EUA05_21460 [Mycobacterium paragordonae]
MYAAKLHTRQSPVRHHLRALAAAAGLGLAAWFGAGIAHADDNHEREACALMDDSNSAIHFGYGESVLQYAYAVLSTKMPPENASHVLFTATRNQCPNHAADLPPGWR